MTKGLRTQPVLSADIYNVVDIFRIPERLAAERGLATPPRAEYSQMMRAVAEWRSQNGFGPAAASIALLAVDPRNEKQARFVDALGKLGMRTEAIDYRWTYAGSVEAPSEDSQRGLSTLTAPVSYLLGLLAGRAEALGARAEVVVIGGVFDIARSLLDFTQRRSGRAMLVFPKGMLDHRWTWIGLGNPDCPIAFANMESQMPRIFGIEAAGPWSGEVHGPTVGGMAGI